MNNYFLNSLLPSLVSVLKIFDLFQVTHFVNGVQFLNVTLVFALPPVALISPVTRIYAFE